MFSKKLLFVFPKTPVYVISAYTCDISANTWIVNAQIDKPPSLFDRCGRLWGSGSTGGRSSTPSGPGWPRPCPSPRHLHGSAFTASSSPHRYERGDRLCPTDGLLGETATAATPTSRHRFLPHHWSTLKHFLSWRAKRERERERLHQSPKPQEGHYTEFQEEMDDGDADKGHCRLSKNERLVDQEDARDQAEFGSVWLWAWMYSTSYPLMFARRRNSSVVFPLAHFVFLLPVRTRRSSCCWTALNWIPTSGHWAQIPQEQRLSY